MWNRFLACGVGVTLLSACGGPSPSFQGDQLPSEKQGRAFPPVTVVDSERRELPSAFVDEVYKLHVYFPRGYQDAEDPLPVVYLLDAEYSFGAVAYAIRRLIKDNLIPPVLLVGVAYEVPYDDYYRRRERDFTPTVAHIDEFPAAGHADSFVQFLRRELIPFVNSTYRVNPEDRTIVGLSFSGLFSTFLLFRETGLFSSYVIVSPSLWWDNQVVFQYESEYRESHADLPARVYFAAGEADGPNILRGLDRMSQVLSGRQYRGLEFRVRLFPEETHRTVFPLAVSHGLRYVFSEAPYTP